MQQKCQTELINAFFTLNKSPVPPKSKLKKNLKKKIKLYIGVFGVKPWNSPKKIKVSIDGSPTKSQKTMGTLICVVNSAALHQKHLCIF